MIRNGEINPFELAKMSSATPLDYAVTTIKLLETMRRDHPQRREGLVKLRDWIERELRGENAVAATAVPRVTREPLREPQVGGPGFRRAASVRGCSGNRLGWSRALQRNGLT